MYMFEPAMPPKLPTEMRRPIPTARLDDGARLLAILWSVARLSRSINVVSGHTSPADDVDERTIQARRHRKQKAIRQSRQPRVWDCELTDEACRGDSESDHDERGPLLHMIRPEGEYDRHDHCEDVDRYRQKLSVC